MSTTIWIAQGDGRQCARPGNHVKFSPEAAPFVSRCVHVDELPYLVDETFFAGAAIVSRGIQAGAWTPWLYLVGFPVTAEDQAEFDRWYETEHLSILATHPSWRACHLYEGNGMSGFTRLATHYWLDETPQGSKEQALARATEWRKRMSERAWFGAAQRILLHLDP